MVINEPDLSDAVVPIYKFEWDSGRTRTTDELDEQLPTAIENLATLGRDDDECSVSLIGYNSNP